MPKVNITKELAEKIKELRINNKVKAVNLADHIKKSPAYITKLENGDIKKLDYDELLTIFDFISKDEEDFGKIIDKLSLEPDLKEQTWFLNFDTVTRKIPIPSDLVDYINKIISDLGLTISFVVNYVNQNDDLSDFNDKYNIDVSKFKCNYWHTYEDPDGKISTFIRMELNLNQIIGILEKKIDTSNYVTIQSILYNLFRLGHGSNVPLNDEDNEKIKEEVVNILNSYKFYSSIEKNRVLESAVTKQEFNSLLNEFDLTNRKLINEFLSYISFLSEFNIKYTNEKMVLVNQNFDWDASYLLSITSLPFCGLDNISKSMKKNLLEDIKNLIENYKNKPEPEKTIEFY
ncbi:hypothetical protein [Desulfosporosinus sp. SB140]|uniref:hypothetical protein n=1 Tax=Desulfosporosinus paludis TaxID=3115649 RepID=UPI00388E5B36